jgi:hypothetical protein
MTYSVSERNNMTTKTTTKTPRYTPEELKILVDALNGAPSYLSKRFILIHLCGWSDDLVKENMRMRIEEKQQEKIGDITWR